MPSVVQPSSSGASFGPVSSKSLGDDELATTYLPVDDTDGVKPPHTAVNMGGTQKKSTGKAKRGRRALEIAPGFGQAVYEAMVRKRRADGQAWGTRDLATAMKVGENTPARWIRGTIPGGSQLAKLAQTLGVTMEALLRGNLGEIYLINLPAEWQRLIRAHVSQQPDEIRERLNASLRAELEGRRRHRNRGTG